MSTHTHNFRATIPAAKRLWFLRLLTKHRCGKPVGVQSLPRGKGAWSYSVYVPAGVTVGVLRKLIRGGVRQFAATCTPRWALGGGKTRSYGIVTIEGGHGVSLPSALAKAYALQSRDMLCLCTHAGGRRVLGWFMRRRRKGLAILLPGGRILSAE
jgi:hypothetical protein